MTGHETLGKKWVGEYAFFGDYKAKYFNSIDKKKKLLPINSLSFVFEAN